MNLPLQIGNALYFVIFIYNVPVNMLLCPIIPDKKLAFVAIPKNAGTSIRVAFGIAQGFVEAGEPVIRVYERPWPSVATKRDIQALKEKGYLRFCIARNPWIRLVSCWQDKAKNPAWLTRNAGAFQMNEDFLPFVRAVCSIPDEMSDRHFRSQFTYVFDGGVLLVDRTLRFETLHADWEVLREQFALPALPHRKRTDADNTYLAIYEKYPETRALVAKRYARDIEFFGYDFSAHQPPS